ncbi:MAG TPA: hypothetical protein VGR87_16320 [Candidatus Limnocylindria bacterium]|nr:hypothetical protein [Candidatus Limnocylindria bacterium]
MLRTCFTFCFDLAAPDLARSHAPDVTGRGLLRSHLKHVRTRRLKVEEVMDSVATDVQVPEADRD